MTPERGGPVEPDVLELVDGLSNHDHRVPLGEIVDDRRLALLRHLLVDERVVRRKQLVEEHTAECRGGGPAVTVVPALGEQFVLEVARRTLLRQTHLDLSLNRERAAVDCHLSLGGRGVHALLCLVVGRSNELTGDTLVETGQVEQTRDHVQTRHGERATRSRREDVVRGQHQDACLGLSLCRQREVNSHLVTVEVGVEGLTHQRVELNGLALDELRLECLDTQTVQRRCTVEQHGVLGDDLFEDVPHLDALALDHALCRLDVLRVVQIDQTLHHERLEQLESHQLGQTTLVQLELRTDDDDGTTRVVDALTEQVLTEATLLALEQIAQGLQRAVTRSGDRTSTTTVVEQGVDRLLQHPLLVVDDDLGSTEVDQSLEAVVAVDDAAVQVVEVGRRETSTVELNHRAKLRRDHRNSVEDHAHRRVAVGLECRNHLEAL